MEENLEIEFKILLNKEVYNQIISDYPIDVSYTQTNYYLMHPILNKLKYSLRIREKNNQYELTLKQPQTTGTLETNLIIDKETKDKILNNQLIHNKVFDLLSEYNLDSTMFNTNNSLKTLRKEIHTPYGLICLDYNCYNHMEDYELEYEVVDYTQGKQAFLKFIKQYNLSYKHNCISKIHRLINSLSK
ncbi:MAG: CYTH domain-containing protein [[Clostridium] spiroforme]|uniref:CYTH domain-containing protein n=1 Tax=Thomasclavelia spiroformis TaxID=29348 RepID=A0A943EGA2_9FIRM|nr:CYTH domain-containing protein [Thomasclavelia spiroformis]MBS5587421.1 CYTH domain-containing protein [Thomasclavelia spiroformis]